MILVAYDHQIRDISSVCHRARAKLIVYQIDKVASENLGAFNNLFITPRPSAGVTGDVDFELAHDI